MSLDHENIEPQNPAIEAREHVRYYLKNGLLPAILDWKLANTFKYAWGPVPLKITQALEVAASASWGDIYRAINRRLNPPKQADLEEVHIDCRREMARPPRVAKPKVPEPAAVGAAGDATPDLNDWRAAVSGEK